MLGFSRSHCRGPAVLGREGAFGHFGSVPHELLDNAKPMVDEHNMQTREVEFDDRFHAFCRYWGA